ncbi:DsrE family protein [Streptomyces sp. NPDC052109]|uniref:DsrE family protein n=1 Tax=Streptomyces sp. NPDC052109 TaxID=3155527 RepID=UPI00342CC38E
MAGRAVLAIIERGYRGAAEVQFSDLLYVSQGLHSQLGATDLLLRGSAVTYAVAAEPVPVLCAGPYEITVPDPRRSLRELLASGVRVWVDEVSLARSGCGPDRLMDGAEVKSLAELAAYWRHYEGVWFL